jgi:hypothetical protein
VLRVAAAYSPDGVSSQAKNAPSEVFGNIEQVLQENWQ